MQGNEPPSRDVPARRIAFLHPALEPTAPHDFVAARVAVVSEHPTIALNYS
jgi:hypothetical protein